MELSVSKADLLRELQFFQGIVERKNTIPILANVLIDAKGSEVRLAATDLEVGLKSRCPAKIEKPGSLTLPAKKLFEIVKALPDTDVLIQEDKNGVKVAAERFESRLQTMSRDDFPAMPDGGGAGGDATLPRDITRQMVAKTQFAITGEDTRYFLNGALLVLQPKDMSMVATDGHRLALVTAPRESAPGAPDELRVIVQKKTLLELGRLLGEPGDEVTFEKGENHLFFRFADRVLVSRMIDGQFPAYERVIPKGNDKAVEFDRDRLTNAVKRVALLANERSRSVKFQIDPGEVTVTSNSSEFGEAKEVIPVEYSGPSVTICFNAQYVLDFLGRRRDRGRRAAVQGRDEPGRDETRGCERLRLHVRDHADANLSRVSCQPVAASSSGRRPIRMLALHHK